MSSATRTPLPNTLKFSDIGAVCVGGAADGRAGSTEMV